MAKEYTTHSEPRTLIRLNFGNSAQLPLYESWFSSMAAEGKHLISWGTWFCRFALRNPKQVQYRIDLCEMRSGKPHTPPEHKGWMFVCKRDDAFVYRADSKKGIEEPLPFALNPRKRFKSLQEQRKNIAALSLLLFALGLLITIVSSINITWRGFLTGSFGYFLAAAVLFVCALYLIYIRTQLQRTYRQYKTRQEEKRPDWRKAQRASYSAISICTALFLAAIVPLAAQGLSKSEGNLSLPPTAADAPLPWLESIDGDLIRVTSQSGKYYDTNNFLVKKWSMLAPRQYTARQCGVSEDGTYYPMIESQSVTCLFKFSAERLFNESIAAKQDWSYVQSDEVNNQFDQISVFSDNQENYYVVARQNKTVLTVKYNGSTELSHLIFAIFGAMR